jgi:DNA-binding response OmpR family regulator
MVDVHGSAFLAFPLHSGSAREADLDNAAQHPDGTGRRPGILIVEDEADLASTCARFLRRHGYRPRVVYTGSEALEALAVDPPDLVVADLRLPGGVSGLDVVRHARHLERRIPVILCTAHASDQTRQEALEAGAAAYLPKPFSLAELRAAIDRALGQVKLASGDTFA